LLFQILGNQGFLPPMLAAWMPNLLFGLGGTYLLWRSE
jgi:lipopolysaccharide export LptBFGC system permease protein LptF